jgi:hypothetical protein
VDVERDPVPQAVEERDPVSCRMGTTAKVAVVAAVMVAFAWVYEWFAGRR